jgi:hypothetical protein
MIKKVKIEKKSWKDGSLKVVLAGSKVGQELGKKLLAL